MRTTKAFSTISYLSDKFLEKSLNELLLRKVISFWCYVKHYAEEDEKKIHKHLFIIPNGRLDTDVIESIVEFEEDATKPLRNLPCRPSKFDDYYLYAKHDTSYLATKLQSRHYHYEFEDFKTSDSDYLLELTHLIDKSKYFKTQQFVELLTEGYTVYQLAEMGFIPVQQITSYVKLAEMIYANRTLRTEECSHE